MRAEKPVDRVEVMDVGFDDDFAERRAPKLPLLELFLFVPRGRKNRFVALQSELQELAMYFADLPDRSGIEHLLRFDIHAAITLLEAERDVDLAVGAVG